MVTVMMAMLAIPKPLLHGQSQLPATAAYPPTPCAILMRTEHLALVGATVFLVFAGDTVVATTMTDSTGQLTCNDSGYEDMTF